MRTFALRRSFNVSPFARKVSTLFSGNLAGQLAPILVAPIITRLYTPGEFGVFSVYLSIVGIGAVLSTGRYELAILLPRRRAMADSLLALSLSFVGATAVLAAVGIGLTSRIRAEVFGSWLWAVPAAVLCRGTIQALVFAHSRRQNYLLIAISRAAQGAVVSGLQIGLGLLGWGAGGLVLGSLVSYGCATAVSVAGARRWILSGYRQHLRGIIAAARRYNSFPKFNLPHAGFRVATVNLPVVLLGFYFTEEDVGHYALCYGVTVLPLSLLSQSLFQVFSEEISCDWRERGRVLRSRAASLLRKLAMFTAMPFVLSIFVAPSAFALVFGEEWRMSGELYRYLSPMIIAAFFSSVFSFVPQLMDRQRKAMVLEGVGFVLMLLSIGVGGKLGNLEVAALLFSTGAALLTIYRLLWYFSLLEKAEERE